MTEPQLYLAADCAVIWHTRDACGGLSNMARSYPLIHAGRQVPTAEHLYQSTKLALDQREPVWAIGSPVDAKQYVLGLQDLWRPDWLEVRLTAMYWCASLKLLQHYERLQAVLDQTGDRRIVERSRRDAFWAAQPQDDQWLLGQNWLGHIWESLRRRSRRQGQAGVAAVESRLRERATSWPRDEQAGLRRPPNGKR